MKKETLTTEETLNRIHRINLELLLELDRVCQKYHIRYYLCWGALLGAMRHRDFIPWDNDVDVVITRAEYAKLMRHKNEFDPALYEIIDPEDYGKKYFDMVPRLIYRHADIHFGEGFAEYYEGKADKIALDFFFLDRFPGGLKGKFQIFSLELLYGLANAHRFDIELKNYHGILKAAAIGLNAVGHLFPAPFLRKRIAAVCSRYNHSASSTYLITNDTIATFGYRFPVSSYGIPSQVPIGNLTFPGPADPDRVLRIIYGDYMKLPPKEQQVPHWGHLLIKADNFTFYS